MEPEHRAVLRRFRVQLSDQLLVSDTIVPFLYQEGVLTAAQMDQVESQLTNRQKNLKLLDLLPNRGPRAFSAFLEALDDFSWIRDRMLLELQNTARTGSPGENTARTGSPGENTARTGSPGENTTRTGSPGENTARTGSPGENTARTGSPGENTARTGSPGENTARTGSPGENTARTGSPGENTARTGSPGENTARTGSPGENTARTGSPGENTARTGSPGENTARTGSPGVSAGSDCLIPDSLLQKVPSDRELSRLAARLGAEWEVVLLDLGVSAEALYRCRSDHSLSTESAARAGLVLWRRAEGRKATLGRLLRSLEAADLHPSVLEDAVM